MYDTTLSISLNLRSVVTIVISCHRHPRSRKVIPWGELLQPFFLRILRLHLFFLLSFSKKPTPSFHRLTLAFTLANRQPYLRYGPYDSGNAKHTLTLAAKITANETARAWFSHGLAWIYGYNHEEGIACMMKAAAADPDCAMAHWAIAYSLSSSYNWAPGLGCGYDSIQTAVGLKDKCNDLEKDLIDALTARSSKDARDGADPTKLNFGNPPELNVAFAAEMAKLAAKYPEDLDVQASGEINHLLTQNVLLDPAPLTDLVGRGSPSVSSRERSTLLPFLFMLTTLFDKTSIYCYILVLCCIQRPSTARA